jgi:hypothetical protein
MSRPKPHRPSRFSRPALFRRPFSRHCFALIPAAQRFHASALPSFPFSNVVSFPDGLLPLAKSGRTGAAWLHHRRPLAWRPIAQFERRRSAAKVLRLSEGVPELRHFFSFFSRFLWAHRSGNSSPLRPTRLLLCRFRPGQRWVPSHNADASLRLHAPSLSLMPQRKRGRKKR